ncbi:MULTISPECIES: hypothetical protein [Prochlorococcus]|uniref:Nif11 domain-containing protein n=1 Tax=Prochlorococcus marinus (strain SARG / CCMP1375 / SS120) TaxID=167539 RepID=Q7VEB0_PROMA|nr:MULTISPECIES: hypothetical protein [Prochlorococcus]AAP99149.1 Predicted protein [Prochlorococcus marinus subsp. marinus str. CCMP1375]KGG11581.1 hypothetical protein EV04_1108 [Prochlorococcus marinus str. LG]KGG18465.1 hypothetical protein EV08_1710 [Prochlorococcus marinus str. SS2]KGG22738.1 hypothetical protein EV09_1477 [Prochlorococcus marinus str. SS35]KGG32614.1 hypothetical protein EV10_0930 [Prochlorococcus marinus str. SS51]
MSSNAEALYKRIEADPAYRNLLFRQALQNPQGALQRICEIGEELGLPVTVEEVKDYISKLDDLDTKQWLIKARGGL